MQLADLINLRENHSMKCNAWGKFDKETNTHHHLAHHCADVSAVLLELLNHPIYRARLEAAAEQKLMEVDCARLAAIAFLHDIGKLHPAFQAKGWPDGTWSGKKQSHIATTVTWCEDLEGRIEIALDGVLPDLIKWSGKTGPSVWLELVFAHHGRPVPERIGKRRSYEEFVKPLHYDWEAEEAQLGKAMRCWFPAAFHEAPPLPETDRFHHAFCGAMALADWVGSDKRAFGFLHEFDLDYWQRACEIAKNHVKDIGLASGYRSIADPIGFACISDHAQPTSVQCALADVPSHRQLVILEAETGSGKTEAALWRYASLRAAKQVESLYFAVPTRAAARQLCHRIQDAMQRLFGDPPEAVLAIPGQYEVGTVKEQGDTNVAKGKRLPDWQVLWDDNVEEGRYLSRWAAEHATRFLAAEIAVGTVDQAMLAALEVKHAHLRGFALSRALLVIDEVHASDEYMRHIQKTLLDEHLALGGHALLMSATLGSVARSRFLDSEEQDFEAAIASPYPAIWIKGEQAARAPAASSVSKSVQVRQHSGWDVQQSAGLAIKAAKQGARVLVIRNTVDYAQKTFAAAMEQAPDLLWQVKGGPALHHSRFAVEDRVILDKEIECSLGKSVTGDGGCIVIGTQTLEQSLDIDADFLVTDLCPMDVLLQRIGRLHRHGERSRPHGFDTPQVVVLCPPDGLDPLIQGQENGLGAIQQDGSLSGVYINVPGLQAVMENMDKHEIWHIPAMNRQLVEAATHQEALAQIAADKGWEEYHQRITGKALQEGIMAEMQMLKRDKPLPDRYPDDEKIRTRLGEEGAVVTLEPKPSGPFGAEISQFALPAHWSRGLSGKETVECSISDRGLKFNLGDWQYRYSREGLTRSKAEGSGV